MPNRRARSVDLRPERWTVAFALLLLAWLAACAPQRMPLGPGPTVPRLEADRIVTGDGMELPLSVWRPPDNPGPRPKAVILALHGFNMYSKIFETPGAWWAERGIITYAYDQRGFGAAPHSGLWAGIETLVEDLTTAARLIKARHPKLPLYLLGDSMGGAVATIAFAGNKPPEVEGVILSAPAVWARRAMPWYQRGALWLAARLIPGARFSGRGLDIRASDNREMLRALGRDPLVIKKTRVAVIEGLADLMSEALDAAPRLRERVLLLYGEKDEIIPPEPTLEFWRSLPPAPGRDQRRVLYPDGWHMLLIDLGAEVVLADIAGWIVTPTGALPSRADEGALEKLADLVEDER